MRYVALGSARLALASPHPLRPDEPMLSSLGRIATLLVLCVLVFDATAQTVPDWAAPSGGVATEAPSNSGGGGPPPPPTTPPQVPIDGGLGLLALAGGAYAVRRLRKKGKGEDETEE